MTSTKNSILKLIALLIVCIFVFCACTQKEEDPIIMPGTDNSQSNSSSEALQGGTLRIPMNSTVQTMHPLFVKQMQMRNVFSMIFEPLIELNDLSEPSACIAESWKYDSARGVWVFQIRTNVHWHADLGEITGADAAFTINTILANPDSIYYSDVSKYILRAEGSGNTLTVYPKINSYALLYALNIPVIPQSYYEGKPANTLDIPRGSGCFSVDSLTFTNTKMELSSFAKWWKKLPSIEKVVALGYADSESMLEAFKAGELDCAPSSLKTTGNYELLTGVKAQNYLDRDYVFLGFNTKQAYVSNTTFRKAIAYAINKTKIINNVYLTKASGAEQPLFNDTSLSSASNTRYDYNISKSKELLAQLGYKDENGDGYLEKGGVTAELTTVVINTPSDPVRLEAVEYIKNDLKSVGIKLKVFALSEASLKDIIKAGSYHLVLSGYYLSDVPNLHFALDSAGEGNFTRYSSADMVSALNAVDTATNLEELKTSVRSIQKVLSRDLPQLGLFFEMNTLLYRSNLTVANIHRESNVYAKINTWYFTSFE